MFPSSAPILRQFYAKNGNFCVTSADVCLQSIRWHRKPRWVPIAKSKLFRIPVRPVAPEGEKEELLRLNNHYRTQMKAVRRFLTTEYLMSKHSLTNASSDESTNAEALEFEKCVLENEAWNSRIALIRQNRFAEELKARDTNILRVMERTEKERETKLQKTKETIRQLEEDSKTFITMDNIDEAIEQAMSNYVDYNFAIDLEGNIIAGRDTGPTQAKKLTSDSQQP